MTITEMHVWFRQYAQQMGMQNVRAILPEQIDTLINTATKDTIDEIVRNNVGTTNDRVITDNSKLSNINALRSLYRVKTIQPSGDDVTKKISDFKNEPYKFEPDSLLWDELTNTGEIAYYYVDFSVRYTDRQSTPTVSRWFPIRIVDDSYLADVLNDWVLAPRMRTPVMVIYTDDIPEDPELDIPEHLATVCDIYFGENDFMDSLDGQRYISDIRFSYIKKPVDVKYLSDIGGTNVNSDLPVQLQIPMLKHAVDLYRASISGNLFASQENAKEQQREMVRNQARPENDGYQS